jgi:hypothetical protein
VVNDGCDGQDLVRSLLAPTEVLIAGFALQADPPEPTLVPRSVSAQVLRGIR